MITIDEAVRGAATRAGMLDLDLLPVAAPFLGNVKVNDAGQVEGAEDAVRAFKKAKPDLFAPPLDARTLSGTEYAASKAALLKDIHNEQNVRAAAAETQRLNAKFAARAK